VKEFGFEGEDKRYHDKMAAREENWSLHLDGAPSPDPSPAPQPHAPNPPTPQKFNPKWPKAKLT
jgi:hypothetical protein